MVLETFRLANDFTWDRANGIVFDDVIVNQGDANGRKMRVQVVNRGAVENITGAGLNLAWKATNGKGLDKFTVVNAAQGIFEISFTKGMLANVGRINASLQLILPSGGGIVESRPFVISNQASVVDQDSAQSTDSWTALETTLANAEDLEANYTPKLFSLEQQLQQKANDNEVRKKHTKIEPEDASDRLLSLVTGEGTIELKSEPQDGSVGPQSLDRNLTDILGVREENLFSGLTVFGSIVSTDGGITGGSDRSRLATGFIPISPNRTIHNNLLSITTSTSGNNNFTFYDENRNFLATETTKENKIEPPSGARYVRQNLKDGSNFVDPELYWIGQATSDVLSELLRQVEQFNIELDMGDGFRDIFNGEVISETIDSKTGVATSVPGTSTGFIEVNSEFPVYTNATTLTTPTTDKKRYLFYNNFKEYMGSELHGDIINPPEHSRYMRTNLTNYSINTVVDNLYFRQESKVANRLENIEALISNLSTESDFSKENVIRVYDFYNPLSSHTQIIKECMEFVRSLDSRIIVLDTIDWHIDEAILLPENTAVIVDGVTIKQNNEVFDNIFRGDNLEIDPSNPYGYPLNVEEITNIKIIGINGATLEGPDVNIKMEHHVQGLQEAVGDFWGWRCFHISLSKASNFEIYGFNMRRTRSWGVSVDKCHDFKIHDLDYNSTVKNGDGVDVRAGSYNFEVYNITGSTSDDSVAMTAGGYTESAVNYPRSNYVYPLEPTRFENLGLSIEELSIKDGKVYNITTTGRYHGVICLAADGIKVHDIFINNIKEPSPSSRESVVKIYTGYGSNYSAGDLHSIRVNDVISKGAQHAVQVVAEVQDVWFNKIIQEKIGGDVSTFSNPTGIKITNS